MKIIGILGSPHVNGNTNILLDAALEGAKEAGAEVEKLGISGLEINFCIACGKCYSTGKCFMNDGAAMLQAKMMEADGIILASPSYFQGPTAQLKTVFDRFSLGVHCFLLKGRYGASLTTAGGGEFINIAEQSNGYMQACGARTVGAVAAQGMGYGALVDQEAKVAQAKELGKDLVSAISENRECHEQAQYHAEFFQRMKHLVTMMGDKAQYQLDYWRSKGWL